MPSRRLTRSLPAVGSARARRRSRCRAGERRLSLEALEDRTLLSAGPVDDFGNTLASANVITLNSSGYRNQAGNIETAGDRDVFRFTATQNGGMTVRLEDAFSSPLDCYVRVFDGSGNTIAFDDNAGGGLNSLVRISVTAGQTYSVQASAAPTAAAGARTGGYRLVLGPDDVGN